MNKRERLVGGVEKYIKSIIERADQDNKKIVIWGFGRAGKYTRDLLERIGGRKVDYIINGGENRSTTLACDAHPMTYRPSLLWYLDSKETIILSCIQHIEEIQTYIEEEKLDYTLGINLFDVRTKIGNSFLKYIEMKNPGVNFDNVCLNDVDVTYREDMLEYQAFAHSSSDLVFAEIEKLDKDIKFFDYGCGKGGALIYAYIHGFQKIGGVEYSPEITKQCIANIKLLNIDADVICADATEYQNIDNYNVFYFYNPFVGNTFDKVIDQIYLSIKREPRGVHLVYGNPFCHKQLIHRKSIIVEKQILTDLYDPIMNIYKIDNEYE